MLEMWWCQDRGGEFSNAFAAFNGLRLAPLFKSAEWAGALPQPIHPADD